MNIGGFSGNNRVVRKDGSAARAATIWPGRGRGAAEKVVAAMKFVWAFVIGGLICVIGQVLIDKTRLTPARILVGYVCAGILLGAFGVYDKLIDFAGSGAALPLSGFGNLLVNGTREAVIRDGLLGALEGPLTAGSVGIMTAVFAGFILSLMAKPKPK